MKRCCLLVFLCIPFFPGFIHAVEKPNVILFLADDMGLGDTSAYQDFTGNADDVQIATPNMERLARMGVRFTDAHTPASRCSPTRYALLTGRYAFRNRLKWWVLYGSQGDPMIERDRPTLATLFRDKGYGTAMVGKWHVGLRYRRADGQPAAGWEDVDLTQPLFDTPIDHGFDYARFTSRSHGTSGPDVGKPGKKKRNAPKQNVGPGHIHGRNAVGATGNGKELVAEGKDAYVLTKLGSRHSDHAIDYLDTHLAGGENAGKPFFLYYPSNSNHGPYTPDDAIEGVPVKGAARSKAGEPMDARADFVYENDVALGRLLEYLEANDDPRHPGKKLIETTLVLFTSDNGADKDSDIATGPFRSNKGSCFEGGHRVPFIVAWGGGGIGDGDAGSPGETCDKLMGLTDLYATFTELLRAALPDLAKGEKGAEDSISVLNEWRNPGEGLSRGGLPLFFQDHKEAKEDPAVVAMRIDSPIVGDRTFEGKWKVFFDASLLRLSKANPFALYELGSDRWEKVNRIAETDLAPLVAHLKTVARDHRNTGGHRMAKLLSIGYPIVFDWQSKEGKPPSEASQRCLDQPTDGVAFPREIKFLDTEVEVKMNLSSAQKDRFFRPNFRGLGIGGGQVDQVDSGEAILISFDQDVIVESVGIVVGNGVCGGFYQVGDHAPLAIYCVDGDIDDKDQSGLLSDIGVLKAGQVLRLDSSPHYGVETAGRWRLGSLTVRPLRKFNFEMGYPF